MPLTLFWNQKKEALKKEIIDLNQEIVFLKDQLEDLQATQLQLTEQKAETKRLQQARDKAFQSLEEEQNCKAILEQDLELKNATIEHLKEQLEQFVQERKQQDMILKKQEDELQEKQTTIAQLTKDLEEREFLVQTPQELSKNHEKTKKIEEVINKQENERTLLKTHLSKLEQIVKEKKMATEIKEKETCVQNALQAAEEHKSSLQHRRNERNDLAHPRLPREVLLAIGGLKGDRSTNIIESYDSRANRWVGVANCDETPRAHHGAVLLRGSVYLIGGSDGVHRLCTTRKYDLANHTWQEVAPMHTRRSLVSVALLDGFIYAMGGFNGWQSLNTAEKYFPGANKWIMIVPMNEQRSNTSSTAYNGKIYICGGSNEEQCLSTAECYDPRTNQWTMISAMSSVRSGAGVIAYFNEIYVLGGFNGRDLLKTVEAYNPNTNTWRPLPPMLRDRSNFGIGVVEDKLYAVGGFNIANCVESFDVKTGVWSEVCDMNVSRYGLSCVVVSDHFRPTLDPL